MSEEVMRQPEENPPGLPGGFDGLEEPADDLLEMLLGSWSQEPGLEVHAVSDLSLPAPEHHEAAPEIHAGEHYAGLAMDSEMAIGEAHAISTDGAVAEFHLEAASHAEEPEAAVPAVEEAEPLAIPAEPSHAHLEAIAEESAPHEGAAVLPEAVEVHAAAETEIPAEHEHDTVIVQQAIAASPVAEVQAQDEDIYFDLPLEVIEPMPEPAVEVHAATEPEQAILSEIAEQPPEAHEQSEEILDPDFAALLAAESFEDAAAQPIATEAAAELEAPEAHALDETQTEPAHAGEDAEASVFTSLAEAETALLALGEPTPGEMHPATAELPDFELEPQAHGSVSDSEELVEAPVLEMTAEEELIEAPIFDMTGEAEEPIEAPVFDMTAEAEELVEAPAFEMTAETDAAAEAPFDDSQWPGQDDLAAMLADFGSEPPAPEQFADSPEGEEVEMPDLLGGDFYLPADAELPESFVAAQAQISASDEGMLDDLIASIDMEIQQAPLPLTARELAQRESTQSTRYVVFTVSGMRFGLPMTEVLETERLPRITALPNVPEFVHGITNLRGEIVPLLDTRALLGLGDWDQSVRASMLIVRPNQDEQLTGLIVDDVNGLADVLADSVHTPHNPVAPLLASMLTGVCEHREHELNLINLQAFFASPELQQLGAQ